MEIQWYEVLGANKEYKLQITCQFSDFFNSLNTIADVTVRDLLQSKRTFVLDGLNYV